MDYKLLQFSILIFIFFTLINHKYLNKKINIYFNKQPIKDKKGTKEEELDSLSNVLDEYGIKLFIFLLPVIILIYYDMKYPNFFMKNLELGKIVKIKNVNYILKILGAYGIIQILAQDMGLKTGYVQRELVQSKIIQFFIFAGTAFALTNDISQSVMGTLIYFILKYAVSNNQTSMVCFERT
tara:strand:- start:1055 stop:1600 length:546 start_codon:yes stop_codon:yes gene_type:complete